MGQRGQALVHFGDLRGVGEVRRPAAVDPRAVHRPVHGRDAVAVDPQAVALAQRGQTAGDRLQMTDRGVPFVLVHRGKGRAQRTGNGVEIAFEGGVAGQLARRFRREGRRHPGPFFRRLVQFRPGNRQIAGAQVELRQPDMFHRSADGPVIVLQRIGRSRSGRERQQQAEQQCPHRNLSFRNSATRSATSSAKKSRNMWSASSIAAKLTRGFLTFGMRATRSGTTLSACPANTSSGAPR